MWQASKRRWPLIIVLTAIVLVLLLTYALRTVLLPFILGLIFAYAVLPAFSWVEKRLPVKGRFQDFKRIGLIVVAYILIVGLAGVLGTLVFFAIRDSFVTFGENASSYFSGAVNTLQSWTQALRDFFPAEYRQQVDQFILEAGNSFWSALKSGTMSSLKAVPSTLSLFLGLATLPIFLFYLLKDWEKLSNGLYSGIPSWASADFKATVSIIGVILGRYVRAELVLGLVVGLLDLAGLLILRIHLAPVLAILGGLGELVPIVGPLLAGVTATIIALATAPDKAIWVALLFLTVQGLENLLLVPRIHGGFMRVHPAIVLVVLAVGTKVAGIWGLILSVPLTATVFAVYQQVVIAPQNGTQVPLNNDKNMAT